jgi:precorrin-4/cobalt-precorrin-4 C11-methyltransferase
MPGMPVRNPIYIVGAGPGDPELITVKGQRLLQQADVVMYTNSLIPVEMLAGCRHDAELIATAELTLEQILGLMIDRVRSQHKKLVRLHDGDPSIYSAIYEQIQGLRAANLEFEIVPGVSVFQLAAARLGLELTLPEVVQTIILTRISGRSEIPETEELASLAAHQASLCLYLSAKNVEIAQQKLLQHYPADLAIAICYRLGWQDEKILIVPLKEMVEATQKNNLTRTTLFIISPVLAENLKINSEDLNIGKRSQLYRPSHAHLFRSGFDLT